MNRIERYLGKVIVSHTLLVLLVLMVILGFSEFMIQLGKLSADYTLEKGTLYTVLKLPVYGYELFPIALLIGTLMGLGSLANHAELTILRVTGWSIGRIFWAVLKSALILWLLVAIIGETLGPKSEAYAKKMRDEALHRTFSVSGQEGFWIKDEQANQQRYIHVERFVNDHLLAEVTLYHLQDHQLQAVTLAKKAIFKGGVWQLEGIEKQNLAFEKKNLTFVPQPLPPLLDFKVKAEPPLKTELPLSPDLLESLNVEVRYMGIVTLYDYIQFLRQNGLDAAPYELAFWRKIASPFVIIGMLALVFPLIFGSQRQVSMGQRIFVGILIGMGFTLLNQIFGNLSVVYHIPVIIGAFLPSLLLILLAFLLMRRVR
jgi:lipopolysaccharide export system permease protein